MIIKITQLSKINQSNYFHWKNWLNKLKYPSKNNYAKSDQYKKPKNSLAQSKNDKTDHKIKEQFENHLLQQFVQPFKKKLKQQSRKNIQPEKKIYFGPKAQNPNRKYLLSRSQRTDKELMISRYSPLKINSSLFDKKQRSIITTKYKAAQSSKNQILPGDFEEQRNLSQKMMEKEEQDGEQVYLTTKFHEKDIKNNSTTLYKSHSQIKNQLDNQFKQPSAIYLPQRQHHKQSLSSLNLSKKISFNPSNQPQDRKANHFQRYQSTDKVKHKSRNKSILTVHPREYPTSNFHIL